MSYKQKLLDPRWQKKRLSIFERDKWQCTMCESTHKTLHAHHVFYEQGAEPWDYPDYALVTLCADCHELEHEALKASLLSLSKAMAEVGIRNHIEISYLESIVRQHFKSGVFYG